MFKRTLQLLLFACLVIAASWAADNPFAGDWKLNPSKSQIPDQMKVDSVGGNKYAFDFGGGPETIVVDGTNQPSQVYGGDTLSVAVEGDTWKVIRKRNGHLMLTAIWSLSKDGRELTDHFTGFNADHSPYHLNQVYRRKAGGSGFAGTWVRTSMEAVNYVVVFQIRPYEEDGLSFIDAASQFTGNMDFAASLIRRLDEHTLELMRKKKDGELSDFLQLKLSSDLKTLTITRHSASGSEPHVLVFERQQQPHS
ncbi:MAG TPA: hypothetical protein VFI72_06785 [Candidatus Angelobacter sp.]|nr:hypothetical protein [Candidatus Angelobacter sp.]